MTLPADSVRGGLLGKGAILMSTSYPNRTSVVIRGKWILENVFGTPPPPPPPNVPALAEEKDPRKVLPMREQMAAHRKNPVCASCHAQMDPIGFAMENFDAVGRWLLEVAGPDAVAEADARFHGRIMELADNQTLEKTTRNALKIPSTASAAATSASRTPSRRARPISHSLYASKPVGAA